MSSSQIKRLLGKRWSAYKAGQIERISLAELNRRLGPKARRWQA